MFLWVNNVAKIPSVAPTPPGIKNNEHVSLVLIGKPTDYKKILVETVNRLKLSARVKFLDYVELSDLPLLYRNAMFATYPSVFEGFGIPIIEALHCNIAVLTSTGSCFEEAGGKVATGIKDVDGNVEAGLAEKNIKDGDKKALKDNSKKIKKVKI